MASTPSFATQLDAAQSEHAALHALANSLASALERLKHRLTHVENERRGIEKAVEVQVEVMTATPCICVYIFNPGCELESRWLEEEEDAGASTYHPLRGITLDPSSSYSRPNSSTPTPPPPSPPTFVSARGNNARGPASRVTTASRSLPKHLSALRADLAMLPYLLVAAQPDHVAAAVFTASVRFIVTSNILSDQ